MVPKNVFFRKLTFDQIKLKIEQTERRIINFYVSLISKRAL